MAAASSEPVREFHARVRAFLARVFGDEAGRAWVTGFDHDPAASSEDGKVQAIAWGGSPYDQSRDKVAPDHNNYLCISTFRPGEDGKVRRRTALHDKTFALMIDDVGEKVPTDRVRLAPTFKIQTSPNSQQWWYVLDRPETSGPRVKALIDNLINAGLMTDNRDPGMRGVNRYGRLPFGINTKAKYLRADGSYPTVHLVEAPNWSARPSIEAFAQAFGVSLDPPAPVELSSAPDRVEAERFNRALLGALVTDGLYKEDRGGGKHEITCPWVHEHTGEADNGTAVFEAGYIDPSTGEIYMLGGFKCHHGHGEDVTLRDVVTLLHNRGHDVSMLAPARPDAAEEFAAVPLPVEDDELLDLPMAYPAPEPPAPIELGRYEPTDIANAYRLATIADGRLKWHADAGKWVFFDGCRWNVDYNECGFGLLRAAVGTYIVKLASEAGRSGMGDEAKALSKWAISSRMSPRLSAMGEHFKEIPAVAVRHRDIDQEPLALGAVNGVVDLSSGRLLPSSKATLVLANTGVVYDPLAEAPDWEPFLWAVLGYADGTPDPAMFAYMRAFLGYCVTGLRTHELFTILHGSGTNGKSTLLAVLEKVAGDYGRRVRPSVFELSRNKAGSSSATPELAQLPGARIVAASETAEGSRLDMELVKQMTGDDLSARHLYREEFQFTPTFKVLFSTNHLPIVTGTDNATWRRLHPVPFDRRWRLPTDLPGQNLDCPPADLTLRMRLMGQLAGIQAWLVAAARDFIASGCTLPPMPARISEAQSVYRSSSDVLGNWLADRCDVDPEAESTGLYTDYRRWCEEMGLHPISAMSWGRSITERFGPGARRGGVVYHRGLRLKDFNDEGLIK